MQKSPFHDYANALIKVPEPVVGFGTDKYGNQLIGQKLTDYVCIVDAAHANTFATQSMPGKNTNSIYLKGYLIDPLFFPASIKFPCECFMEYKMGPGYVQEGKIRLIYPVSNPYILGEKIDDINQVVGWFYY